METTLQLDEYWTDDPVPTSHEHRGIRVVWGFPTSEDLRRAEAGEIYVGGCVIAPFSRWCPECELGFG